MPDDKIAARLNRDAQLQALSASRNADAARKSREAQTVNAQKTLSYGGARVGNLPVQTQERLVHRASGLPMQNPMQRTASVMGETGGLAPGALPNANAVAAQTLQGIQQNDARVANIHAAGAAREAGAQAFHDRQMAAGQSRMNAVGQAETTGQRLQGVLSQQSVINAGAAGINNPAYRQSLGLGSGNGTSVTSPTPYGSVGQGMDPAQAQALLAQQAAMPTGINAGNRDFDAMQSARPGSGMGAGLERAAANVVSTAGGASISQKDVMDFARSSGQDFTSAKRQLESEAMGRANQQQLADRSHELATGQQDVERFKATEAARGQIDSGLGRAKVGAEVADRDRAEGGRQFDRTAGQRDVQLENEKEQFKAQLAERGLDRDSTEKIAQMSADLQRDLGELDSETKRELQDALIASQGDPDARMLLESAAAETDPDMKGLATLRALDYISKRRAGMQGPVGPDTAAPPPPVSQPGAAAGGPPQNNSQAALQAELDAIGPRPSTTRGAKFREWQKKHNAIQKKMDAWNTLNG